MHVSALGNKGRDMIVYVTAMALQGASPVADAKNFEQAAMSLFFACVRDRSDEFARGTDSAEAVSVAALGRCRVQEEIYFDSLRERLLRDPEAIGIQTIILKRARTSLEAEARELAIERVVVARSQK
jgi:hypothetical protein